MGLDPNDLVRLRRAIALSFQGRFAVEPNPAVGCVVARDEGVVGEGWHGAYGGPHAEIVALMRAGGAARGATAYVSLEPCSRTNKTGPCTDALLAAGVRRVVFAAADPNEGGRGAEALRRGGVEVAGPLLEDEARASLAPFLAARRAERPWVLLKWAMTLDGRISEGPGRGGQITGPRARAFLHDLRAHVDAVAVGSATVEIDDPRLTSRPADGLPEGRPQPTRVVFDSALRTPPSARLAVDLPQAPLCFLTTRPDPARRQAWEARGAQVLEVPAVDGRLDLVAALAALRARGIERLLVEGGARVHGALLRAGLADQVTALVAPVVLGEREAPGAVDGAGFGSLAHAPRLRDVRWRRLGDDLLLQAYVPGGLTG